MSPKRTLLVLLASVSLAATALPAAAAASAIPTSYPRNETVYTTGTMWYPPGNFNPFNTLNTTGTIGLLYEPLFVYNPLTDKMVNWLAQSGTWTASNVYTVTLRQGIKWSDGTPLTADDVLYTVGLAKLPSVGDYGIWASSGTGGYLESVTKVDQYTVKFTFSKPAYQQWSNWLYSYPILPSVNWGTRDATSVLFANATNPVGSGPYTLLTYNSTEVVWQKNDSWWGESIGLNVTPKYVIDLADLSNNVTLSQMLAGGIDLSNNFLPGIASIVTGLAGQGGYSITTYYPKAPYMLSANTAWLVPNVTKKPTSDPVFRRALAESINVSQIVTNVYTNIVAAANPTGLLPVWSKYVDTSLVKQYGFTYNPAAAKALLESAGYKMGSDGYFRNKDGSPINLSLIVPSGWTDWMAAIQSIAQSAKKAGNQDHPWLPGPG